MTTVVKLPSSEIWAVEIKYGVAPKLNKHYSRICDDAGATQKYIIYGGDDEFPARASVLFDRTAGAQLPLDALLAAVNLAVNAVVEP